MRWVGSVKDGRRGVCSQNDRGETVIWGVEGKEGKGTGLCLGEGCPWPSWVPKKPGRHLQAEVAQPARAVQPQTDVGLGSLLKM